LRTRLHASHAITELGVGHLIQHPEDTAQRGARCGSGFEAGTAGWSSVRAGQGLLVSTTARAGTYGSAQTTQADGRYVPWHGYVKQAAQLGSDGGLARYRLTMGPWLDWLSLRIDSFVFQDLTAIEIIERVFADYPASQWRLELNEATVAGLRKRSLCTQYRESDLAFVSRLLAQEGLHFWFEHLSDDGTQADAFVARGGGKVTPPNGIVVEVRQSGWKKINGRSSVSDVKQAMSAAASAKAPDAASVRLAAIETATKTFGFMVVALRESREDCGTETHARTERSLSEVQVHRQVVQRFPNFRRKPVDSGHVPPPHGGWPCPSATRLRWSSCPHDGAVRLHRHR